MGKPQKYYIKKKKADAKYCILYDSIYMRCAGKISIVIESRSVVTQGWGGSTD